MELHGMPEWPNTSSTTPPAPEPGLDCIQAGLSRRGRSAALPRAPVHCPQGAGHRAIAATLLERVRI